MQLSISIWLALFVAFVPSQARHVSRMVMETHEDACTGLNAAECCAQTLDLAGFRATGDQLPKGAKNPVRFSCSNEAKNVPVTACRSIAMARGISASEVSALCVPETLEKRCSGDARCSACVAELEKLRFKASYRACYAVTFVSARPGDAAKVIILHAATPDAAGSGVEVRKRRTVVQ